MLGAAARIAAVVGIVGALVMQGAAAHAADSLSLTACQTSSPSPSPSPTPSSSPTASPSGSPGPTPSTGPNQADEPQNCVPASGTIIRDVRTLQFSASTNTFRSHIREVVAYLDSETSGVPSPGAVGLNCPTADENTSAPGCQSENAAPTSGTYTFEWDSNVITPHNAAYTFRVVAKYADGINSPRTKTASRKGLIVDNFPVQPNAPKIQVATATSVSLSWEANPEPDLAGYNVARAATKDKKTPPKDEDFKVRTTTAGPQLRDGVSSPGTYWYRVQAVRKSYNSENKGFIASAWSDTSGPAVVSKDSGTAGKPQVHRVSRRVTALPPRAAALLTPPGLIPSVAAAPPPVPDAPYSAYLPYKTNNADEEAGPPAPEAGTADDPRGAVIPVAVGAFLVSSALALGRMPF